ncbi:hypothetical protein K8I61_02495 [bacterium]|nr:hypothetical protein [bacterium]
MSADYAIVGKRMDRARQRLESVVVRRHEGGRFGIPTKLTRGELVTLFDRGHDFQTGVDMGDKVKWGEPVYKVIIPPDHYISTNPTESVRDKLDSVPNT